MMDVPVDDQDAIGTVALPRVVRGDGDVAEEAESHRPVVQRVVPGRAHRAEAARPIGEGEVYPVEDTARSRASRVP
jgi:hypothetical protein